MTMTLHRSWHAVLSEELKKPYIGNLKAFLQEERELGKIVYPPPHQIFSAFKLTPFEEVKVVIVGQDPYHGEGQAEGLCFSVAKGIDPPPSLKNIYKELKADLGIDYPGHGSLESWAKQGVLLLNATLTVRAKEPASHAKKGWEEFTDAVLKALAEREDPLVFILWGRFAKEKCERILAHRSPPHRILSAAHPSPFSVSGFLGCRHFSKANEALQKWGKSPINWGYAPH